jgi:hypothetical protein
LFLRAGGAVKRGRRSVKISDIEPLKDLKNVRELYKVLIESLIASGSKERSNEHSMTAST